MADVLVNGDSTFVAAEKSTTHNESDDLKLFDSLFPVLLNDIIGQPDTQTADALKWYKTVSEYNVPHGKKNRGLSVIHSYRFLAKDNITEEGLQQACVIGWCIEWLQAFFLVTDDIMDSSITRRGQPCWYKCPNVGLIAINDALHLETCMYTLLRKYLRNSAFYVDILELFHGTTRNTVIGQTLDLITAPTDRVDFTTYTPERYQAIVKYKTAFYSFYLPVAAAMYMVGIKDEESHNNARAILLVMGEYFQIQDDYLDCYGDPAVTGKIGTDIEDNKCSWLIVQALAHATPEQIAVLQANYARKEEAHVTKVREIFSELNIPKLYHEYEEQSYRQLNDLINRLSGPLPHEMFHSFARKIYKRVK